jgi:hypothetical protein
MPGTFTPNGNQNPAPESADRRDDVTPPPFFPDNWEPRPIIHKPGRDEKFIVDL